jgi:hypothetical protein
MKFLFFHPSYPLGTLSLILHPSREEVTSRMMTQGMRELIQSRFVQLYIARYGEAPHGILEGLAKAVLLGEVRIMSDMPSTWPLDHVTPLLEQAFRDVCSPVFEE